MRRLIGGLLACLILLTAGPAWAAIAFNNSNTPISQNSGATLSGAQTVSSGSNLLAVVYVGWNDANSGIDVACTYAGASMTALTSRILVGTGGTNLYLKAFYLVAPTTGSNTLSCAFSPFGGDAMFEGAVLYSYTGVDQTTPIRAGTATSFSGSTGAGGTQALAVTTSAGDLTITAVSSLEGSPTTDQTLRTATLITGAFYLAGDDGSGASPLSHTWDTHFVGANAIAMVGASLQASGGGGDTTPPTDPAALTPVVQSSTAINLTWTGSTDAVGVAGYDLQRCAGVGCASFAGIASPTVTNYADSGLTAGTSYTYRVRAYDAAGNLSNFATSAQVVTTSTQSRTLQWTPVAPLTQDSFAIFRCVTSATSCTPDTSVPYTTVGPTASSYVDAVSGNPVSCYQVQARLGVAASGFSNIACNLANAVTLTITAAGAGTGVTIPTGITSQAGGSVVGLTATPNQFSDFGGWSGDADCTDGSVTMSVAVNCTATFNLQQGTFAHVANRGTKATKTLSNTISVTPTSTVNQTNLLIVRATSDNISTTSGQTSDHVSVTDSQGNQYVKLGEQTRSGGAAASGVTSSLWASRPFTSVTTVNSVTLTLSTATVANAISINEFMLAANTTFATNPISNVGTNGSSTTPGAVLSGLTSVFRLFLGLTGAEGPNTDAYTQSVNYASGVNTNGTTTGADLANVYNRLGFRRQTATGDSFAPTLGTARNWALVYAALATATAQNASSVTLTNSGAGTGTLTGAGTYYNGTNVTIRATPNAQSQFVAWQTTAGDACASVTSNTVVVQLTQNTTCNAVFALGTQTVTNYTLTITTAGTGGGTTTGAGVYASGTTVNMTAAPNSSSSFDGWTPSICAPGSITMNANQTCTATFTLLPLATMTTINAGTGQGTTTGAGTYFQGQTAILTATPFLGSTFTAWSGSSGCSGTTSPLSVLMDASKTCTATYTVQTGGPPTGFIVTNPYRRCPISYVATISTGTVATVTWAINGVTKRTSTAGVPVAQTTAPYIFNQTLVENGSLITATVKDTSGNSAVFGPATVSCP